MNKLERIEALEAEIKKLKQELSEPEFKAGWYWADEKSKAQKTYLAYYENKTDIKHYGFNNNGDWSEHLHSTFNQYKVPATESEVFEALKKEAIKRGFKEGVTFDRGKDGVYGWTGKEKAYSNNFEYIIGLNALYLDCKAIFHNGKWAEIIDEPFKVCGYEVKKVFGSFEIGCKRIHQTEIINLQSVMTVNNFKTVQFDEYKVTLEEINKILEL